MKKQLANIFDPKSIHPQVIPTSNGEKSSLNTSSSLTPVDVCSTCKGEGYWTDKKGTVQTCMNCLKKLGDEQFN